MTFLAFGNHTVRSLINSPYFQLKKILLLEEKYKNDKVLLKLLETKNLSYQLLDKNDFSRYSFDKKNQGIIAFIKEYNYVSLNSLLKQKSNRQFPLLVMLDGIEDPHNFGAILRTCAALKIDGVIIAAKNQVPVNSTVIKVSMGGVAYVPVCQVNNLLEAINELKKNNYQIISTVCQPGSQEYNQIEFNFPTCIVFGNEHQGIKQKIIQKSNSAIYISMSNNISSLNVSVSCGIVLAQVVSQWENYKS
ncbi:23S rRNA (guanosine(2251)-2'-O)-methyltransferase RlmB [endosymbiont GvMRE of Glomus versiforme]|uniref:23S rRNA (guanosine(2251)-2'-O)-methyltransferase RlmB n=1 Tax=endosymbiont GvMRE of Glomus versiforme TaxID=2039283 RepID=UPI000EC97590|nr:23S rRNA (guanosine(2251)-2'-O)-methyltransferase RlmB [endosymbiont GvMRE of Glomus versiforme]RHZ37296.1 rRNA methyltransferase [endosymbiont GvMRE of Glomus versiforme]